MRPWQYDFSLLIIFVSAFSVAVSALLGTRLMIKHKETTGWLLYVFSAIMALFTLGLILDWAMYAAVIAD